LRQERKDEPKPEDEEILAISVRLLTYNTLTITGYIDNLKVEKLRLYHLKFAENS